MKDLNVPKSFVILAAICAALGLLLVYVAWPTGNLSPDASAESVVQPPTRVEAPQPSSMRVLSLESSVEMIERPLFFVSRRPLPVAVEAELTKPIPTLELILIGTIQSPAGDLALVKIGKDPATLTISMGQEIGGWTVSAIDADRVTMKYGETSRDYVIRDMKSAGPPVATTPTRSTSTKVGSAPAKSAAPPAGTATPKPAAAQAVDDPSLRKPLDPSTATTRPKPAPAASVRLPAPGEKGATGLNRSNLYKPN